MLPRVHRVIRRRREMPGVVSLTLQPADGERAFVQPGQFNMLWAFGVGEAAISVSGNPARPGLVHTIREVGATSRALCRMRVGDELGVRGPFGRGWDVEDGRGGDVVLIGGGLGLAPLRPALYRILARRGDYDRVFLLVGARSPGLVLFRADLARWSRRRDVEVHVTVDHAGAGWTGHVGLPTDLVRRAGLDPGRTLALVCGPEVMMRFTGRALVDRGVAPDRIRLSMERNMKCAIGLCGHCQLGPAFVCRDGPVFTFEQMEPLMAVREL